LVRTLTSRPTASGRVFALTSASRLCTRSSARHPPPFPAGASRGGARASACTGRRSPHSSCCPSSGAFALPGIGISGWCLLKDTALISVVCSRADAQDGDHELARRASPSPSSFAVGLSVPSPSRSSPRPPCNGPAPRRARLPERRDAEFELMGESACAAPLRHGLLFERTPRASLAWSWRCRSRRCARRAQALLSRPTGYITFLSAAAVAARSSSSISIRPVSTGVPRRGSGRAARIMVVARSSLTQRLTPPLYRAESCAAHPAVPRGEISAAMGSHVALLVFRLVARLARAFASRPSRLRNGISSHQSSRLAITITYLARHHRGVARTLVARNYVAYEVFLVRRSRSISPLPSVTHAPSRRRRMVAQSRAPGGECPSAGRWRHGSGTGAPG